MTLTRWKLLAGMLGLSMGGVAAVADPPCRTHVAAQPVVVVPCLPEPAVAVGLPAIPAAAPAGAVQAGFQPPVEVAAPKPGAAAPVMPAPPPVTPVPDLPAPAAPGLMVPAVEPVKPVAEVAPTPRPVAKKTEGPPAVTVSKPADPPPAAVDLPLPLPVPGPAKNAEPAKSSGLPPAAVSPLVLDPVAPARPTAPPPPPVVTRLDPPAVPAVNPPGPPPAQPEPHPTGGVRVVLKLGAGQPRFEVVSGDDALLKVVSDRVDVKSPSEKGEVMSALKAVGGVRFSAPGCEGTCAELTVLPGSGEVELAGDVRVKCKQGRGETEIAASKLSFKLGSAPAYSVPEPSAAVNASFVPS